MELSVWAGVEVATKLAAATLFDVFEDYIVSSYQTFVNIIPLWKTIFKNTSFF